MITLNRSFIIYFVVRVFASQNILPSQFTLTISQNLILYALSQDSWYTQVSLYAYSLRFSALTKPLTTFRLDKMAFINLYNDL